MDTIRKIITLVTCKHYWASSFIAYRWMGVLGVKLTRIQTQLNLIFIRIHPFLRPFALHFQIENIFWRFFRIIFSSFDIRTLVFFFGYNLNHIFYNIFLILLVLGAHIHILH